jgi:hypothetical protein
VTAFSIEVILSGLGEATTSGKAGRDGAGVGVGRGDSEGSSDAIADSEAVIVVTFLPWSDPVELASMMVMLAPSMVNSVPPKAKT